MQVRRIDKITSPLPFCMAVLSLVFYYLLSEAALEISVFSSASNESDYYASIVFSEKEWETARKFRDDLMSIGERRSVVPKTFFYKYKPAKKESFTINSFGYRGKEIKQKEKDEFRIVVFGESRIFGVLLADENTIPAVLEKNLNKVFKDKKITVLNFGVEGLDLQRIADAAKHYYKELEPDMILFYSGANDINEAYLFGRQDFEPFVENALLPPAFGNLPDERITVKIKLLNTLKLTFINDVSQFIEMYSKKDFASATIPSDKLENLDSFIKNFPQDVENVCNYFNERGVYTAYILPPMAQFKKPLSEIERHLLFRHESFSPGLNLFVQRSEEGIAKALAKKMNFKVIDQSEIFNEIKETVYYDGVHFTPKGSKLSANKLSEELVAIIEEMQNDKIEKN